MGRPKGSGLLYTPALAEKILRRLAAGEPLTWICAEEGMPAVSTVNDWTREERPEEVPASFGSDFARARAEGFDAIAADTLRIADDGKNDFMEAAAKEGDPAAAAYAFNAEHVQRSKLRIETRLKLLARWDPKRYGERVTQEHTGEGGGPVIIKATPADENL